MQRGKKPDICRRGRRYKVNVLNKITDIIRCLTCAMSAAITLQYILLFLTFYALANSNRRKASCFRVVRGTSIVSCVVFTHMNFSLSSADLQEV